MVDESGSDSEEEDEESLNSCYSSLSDFVSEMRSSGICGEIRGKSHGRMTSGCENCFTLENKLYPENQEKTACVEYAKVYSPPEELRIPDGISMKIVKTDPTSQSMTESTISYTSDRNSKSNSPSDDRTQIVPDLSGSLLDVDSKSSSTTITPIAKTFSR